MRVKAIILAGGAGTRLASLTIKRAKPAVPFAGKYRIIDFVLSNCVNSNIFDVIILTQYRPHSLNDHVGKGRPWDLDRDDVYPPARPAIHAYDNIDDFETKAESIFYRVDPQLGE